jgi:four helix bundle protein
MEKAKKFEDLVLWQKAHSMVLAGYQLSKDFPRDEVYGLTSQFRRALVSVPANIAEGFVKESSADKARFLNISQGSLEEVKYFLILIKDLGYSDSRELINQANEVGRILNGYRNAVIGDKANS